MKVGCLILLLIVGADGYRKKRRIIQKNNNNGAEVRRSAQESDVEVAGKAARTDVRIQCPDNRFDDEKGMMCMNGETGDVLCADLCEMCCYDPCKDKEVGDVCHLNADDIPPSFLQRDKVGGGDEVMASKLKIEAETNQLAADCAAVPLRKRRWNHPSFSQCGFWGDPHFTKSFFSNRRFDFQGIGIFQLASSKDNSFEVQSFQCSFAHKSTAAVAVGFAVKMDGKITFISKKSETFISNNKCFRFDVRSRHTGASPGYYY